MFWSYAPLSRSLVSNVWFCSILRALRLVWDYQPCISSAFCVPQMKLCTLLKISSPFPSPQPLKISLPSASMNLTFVGPHADWTIWWLIILTDIVGFLYILACMNLSKTNYTLVTMLQSAHSLDMHALFTPWVLWMNQREESLFKSHFDPLAVNAQRWSCSRVTPRCFVIVVVGFLLAHSYQFPTAAESCDPSTSSG